MASAEFGLHTLHVIGTGNTHTVNLKNTSTDHSKWLEKLA